MSENNFEKSVQEKMEGFDLLPAPAVWNAVEKRIHVDKKRRFIFLWLIIAILAIGTGTSLLILSNRKNKPNIDRPVSSANPQPKKSNTDPKQVEKGQQSEESIDTYLQRTPPPENEKSNTVLEKISEEKITLVKNEQPNAIQQKIEDQNLVEEKPSLFEKVLPNLAQQKLEQQTTPTMKTAELKPQTTNLKLQTSNFELAVSLGRSALATGFNLFQGKVNENYLAAPLSGPSANVPGKITVLKPSFSFSAGLVKTKTLSNKLSIKTGISYQFLSVKLMGVSRVDSPGTINNSYSQGVRVSRFYEPAYATNLSDSKEPYFINQFHFLGLSADLSWKIIDNKKTSVRWNNGLSFSRLIASNMLHYDYVSKLYYKDNKRLQKNQLFFNTALSIPVGKKITISPFASFSLTPVLKNYDSTKRYTNYGIRVYIPLNKK